MLALPGNKAEHTEREKKMKITINHNGFHGWNARTVDVIGKPGDIVELSASQVRRLRNAACGCRDCKCGESLLAACEEDPQMSFSPKYFLRIPTSGSEINVTGNYPQR